MIYTVDRQANALDVGAGTLLSDWAGGGIGKDPPYPVGDSYRRVATKLGSRYWRKQEPGDEAPVISRISETRARRLRSR